jgi:hypothetical protein
MVAPLSPEARAAAYAGITEEAFLVLLEIDHPLLAQPIRVVNDMVDILSNGDLYQAFPFDIRLPTEVTSRNAQATLIISAVDQQIINAIRSIDSPPTVIASVILASDPDTVDRGPFEMTVSSVTADAAQVTMTLIYDQIFYNRCPSATFSSADFPGLF